MRPLIVFLALAMVSVTAFAPSTALAADCTSRDLIGTVNGSGADFEAVVFSAIPATGPGGCTYSSLRVEGILSQDSSATNTPQNIWLFLGHGGTINTTGNFINYTYLLSNYSHRTMLTGGGVLTNNVEMLTCIGEKKPDSCSFQIIFPNAFDSTHNKQIIEKFSDSADDSQYIVSGSWQDTDTITDIDIQVDDTAHSANWFDQYSTFNLYAY
jgi:hypothetical protein